MSEIEIKIIQFLLSASVYSEGAIMKNIGITKDQLENSFRILEENNYLESYDDFIAREKLNEDSCCKTSGSSHAEASSSGCSSGGCSSGGCSSGGCSSGSAPSDQFDPSKVKVLTQKAISEFLIGY